MRSAIARCIFLLLFSLSEADAISLDVYAREPQQTGQTSYAQFGLIVNAWTKAYALSVSGGFTASCPDSATIEAQGSTSNWTLFSDVVVTVKVPKVIPGEYVMTGWPAWPAPSTQSCSFKYVGRAKEGIFSIGGFGSSITFGGGDEAEGDTLIFNMVKPIRVEKNNGCER